jgi:hypothetical protein
MKFFITLILANLLNHQMISQNDSIKKFKIDSLNHKLRRDSLHTFRFKKLRPYANLDNRNSFIKNKPANFSGLQLGVIINEYHTFGFGIYSLNPNAKGGSQIKNNYQIANLKYTTFFYEYFLVNKKYLEIDLPFEIGFGNYSARKPNDLKSGTVFKNRL